MKAFEIQIFKDGRWQVDSVYDDQSLAILQAERIDEGKRYSAIRVIEEIFDEASNRTTTRAIYRGGKSEQLKKARKAEPAKNPDRRAAPIASGNESVLQTQAPAARKRSNILVPIMILVLLLFVGFAALFVIHRISQAV